MATSLPRIASKSLQCQSCHCMACPRTGWDETICGIWPYYLGNASSFSDNLNFNLHFIDPCLQRCALKELPKCPLLRVSSRGCCIPAWGLIISKMSSDQNHRIIMNHSVMECQRGFDILQNQRGIYPRFLCILHPFACVSSTLSRVKWSKVKTRHLPTLLWVVSYYPFLDSEVNLRVPPPRAGLGDC